MEQLDIYVDTGEMAMPLALSGDVEGEALIIVMIGNDKGNKELFRQTHDLGSFRQWLLFAIQKMGMPPPACLGLDEGNLLEKIDNYYKNATDDDLEKWADSLFDFRTSHDMRFAFRGCDVPSVVIAYRSGQNWVYYKKGDEYVSQQVNLFDTTYTDLATPMFFPISRGK